MDIVAISEKTILIIELKKDKIKEKDIGQFLSYILWATNNKRLLSKFFKLRLDDAEIHDFIIGSNIQSGLTIANCNFSFKKYSLDSCRINLSNI